MNDIAVLIICGVVLFTTLTFLFRELSIYIHTKRVRKILKEANEILKESHEHFCEGVDTACDKFEEWLYTDKGDEIINKLSDIIENFVYGPDKSEKVEKPE